MDVDWNSPVKTEDTPDPLSRLDIDGEIHKSTSSQPLAILPAPLELLILAARYVDAAHGLTPAIARGPGASDSNAAAASAEHRDEYQQALLIYRRHMSAAIACCSYAAKSSGQDPRLAIRAHLMLAELLVNETRNAQRAEQVISRGLALASSHESLAEYRFQFIYLQVSLSLSNRSYKFARNLLKRTILELRTNYPGKISWLYRFQLTFLDICQRHEPDYSAAITALNDILREAHVHQHTQLIWLLLASKARMAMLQGDSQLASSIITTLARDLSLPVVDADIPDPKAKVVGFDVQHADPALKSIPRPAMVQFLILLSIHQTHAGQTNAARQNIRRVQFLLDEQLTKSGESHPSVTLTLPSAPSAANRHLSEPVQTLTLSTLPRPIAYAYTFLISTIVQIDPIGRRPKCLQFAAVGLERLCEMLDFGRGLSEQDADSNSRYMCGSLMTIKETVKRLTAIRVDLMLTQGELLLMRSNLPEVHATILDATSIARAFDLWHEYKPRILFLQGMLSGFLGQLDKAFDFYAKVIDNVESTSHIGILARSSLLLLRLTQGSRVKLSSSEGHTGSPSPKKPSFDAEHSISSRPVATHCSEDFEDLEGYAKQILQDCDQRVPSLRILALILEALVNGEISKAKRNLTLALQLASDSGNQHIKPVVLTLLACQFTNTRNDQAFRMLHSAHAICGSLGGADRYKDKEPKVKNETEGVLEPAGMARLGLWSGIRLLEAYRQENIVPKVTKQGRINERYERALEAQDKLQRQTV